MPARSSSTSSTNSTGRHGRRLQDFKTPEVIDLDEDMTARDIVEALERLMFFPDAAFHLLRIGFWSMRSAGESRSMLALSDHQLVVVMDAAADLSPEKRAVFLERVAARLQLRGSFTSDDLAKAIRAALQGLIHDKSAA